MEYFRTLSWKHYTATVLILFVCFSIYSLTKNRTKVSIENSEILKIVDGSSPSRFITGYMHYPTGLEERALYEYDRRIGRYVKFIDDITTLPSPFRIRTAHYYNSEDYIADTSDDAPVYMPLMWSLDGRYIFFFQTGLEGSSYTKGLFLDRENIDSGLQLIPLDGDVSVDYVISNPINHSVLLVKPRVLFVFDPDTMTVRKVFEIENEGQGTENIISRAPQWGDADGYSGPDDPVRWINADTIRLYISPQRYPRTPRCGREIEINSNRTAAEQPLDFVVSSPDCLDPIEPG